MSEPSADFDPLGQPEHASPSGNGFAGGWARTAMQWLSFSTMWLALLSAAVVVALHTFRFFFHRETILHGYLKSAIPLVAIGISYLSLNGTVRRTPWQHALATIVGLAFVLWGAEQYLGNLEIVSYIDDLVAFLFVFDLGMAVRENLTRSGIERRLAKAGAPAVKTIETFDFARRPSLDEVSFRELLSGGYLVRRENLLLVGPPGVGKTHLAAVLASEACRRRKRVRFVSAACLAAQLLEAHERRNLYRLFRELRRMELIVIDELGYVPLSDLGAQLLFQVFSEGFERTSFVVTTTEPVENWGAIFLNEQLGRTTAARLTGRGRLLKIAPTACSGPTGQASLSLRLRAC